MSNTTPTDRAPQAPADDLRAGFAAAWSLGLREWTRFIRQRNRVIGAVGQPLLFWGLFAAGLGPTFRLAGDAAGRVSYADYFFPGTVALVVLFTAIFTTISLIEDRREGFLQAVLVSPAPRWALVLGKIGGGAVLASAEGLLLLVGGLFLGIWPGLLAWLAAAGMLGLMALALTGLGFVFAWRTDSSQGFHAVMSLVLFPLWMLSGAFFPSQSGPLHWIEQVNPLSYAVAGLRRLLFPATADLLGPALPSLSICLAVTTGFAIVTFAISLWGVVRRPRGDES